MSHNQQCSVPDRIHLLRFIWSKSRAGPSLDRNESCDFSDRPGQFKVGFPGGNCHWLMISGRYIVFFNDYLHLHRSLGQRHNVAFKHEEMTEIIGVSSEFLLSVNRSIIQNETGPSAVGLHGDLYARRCTRSKVNVTS
jgi:hypothetical protein